MIRLANKKILIAVSVLLVAGIGAAFLTSEKAVDYSTDIKPIINKKCISCHGGVKAKGGFSLLFREEALATTESGKPAIIPGDPDHSEMIRRLTLTDPEERMPYKHEALLKEEISLLKKWVKQGAKWGDHWAYLPVKQQTIPDVSGGNNAIDAFVLEKLKAHDLSAAPRADKADLLRRVSLDLIGVYPDDTIAQKFLQGGDQNAYGELVDSLLASPRFGERWASVWLDIARYADTKGYESDGHRNIWKYRDWVINALNSDMPYNQFIIEQVAGDLLPDPTEDQLIATAFQRNAMSNDEGGTDNEEFRNSANMDRVNTVWEGLMGTTFACVQCHSHPYDPFRHEEYYQFLAYYNNGRDEDVPGEFPLLRQFPDSVKPEIDAVVNWTRKAGGDTEAARVKLLLRSYQPAVNATTADSLQHAVIANNNVNLSVQQNGIARLRNIDLNNASEGILRFYSNKPGGQLVFRLDKADGPAFATMSVKPSDRAQTVVFEYPEQQGIHDVFIQYRNTGGGLKPDDFVISFDWMAFHRGLPGKTLPGYTEIKNTYTRLLRMELSGTPIMLENPDNWKRKNVVFERGNRHTPGKEVQPAVPASLRFAQSSSAPSNRLGLAMWMTSPQHPLVSRTIVNRLWEQLFGTGIVETLEDMGTQGLTPSHQALLDYLSYQLMHDYQWSLKKLLREIVLSSTYQQDSRWSESAGDDQYNKLLARGPRLRLSAEQLRDQALCVSGLLSTKMYGPGVMPWQPDGIWNSPYNGARWQQSAGEDQYRRAVYTYWKRTSPYPSMISFDGAQRVVCAARRIRTNTPLQALTTLNDSAYLDMSRHYALRMISSAASKDPSARITAGYNLLFFKSIPAEKLKTLQRLYQQSLEVYTKSPEEAAALLSKKEATGEPKEMAETAALTIVANALLNLDETITKN
ncbi:DUF1553 domain-containing protein [Flavihumibacter petaseus]|uniref:Cytochrome c domain-containing protein n=1 Tax=Flavihumibacter petaseus NBRC 106054 TaxID=1220578 RepID=A0A0E9N5J8_9BACT|nr:DUF1553 domain-containing protein [Flavihumibacter petaseus]GAO45242.1 hypothetical protein FPE01S_04_04860 [Flavihumibacter petaseus NBRC 106054]